MSKFISPSQASICNLEAVAEVGPIRARRMTDAHEWNDLDITTIEQLAETSLDELQTVRSVGPVIAKKIQASATGWMNKRKRNKEDAFEEHRGFDDVDVSTSSGPNRRRVAVFSDDRGGTDQTGAFQIIAKQYGEEVVREVIDDALSQAEISLTEETTVGWAKNSGDGGRFVQNWYDTKVATGQALFRHKRFTTPWGKYRRHLEPLSCVPDRFTDRDDVQTIDDVPPEHRPDDLNPSDVPFPFIEQPSDLDPNEPETTKKDVWSLAPMERRREMVEWADQVVILVDSGGGDRIRKSARYAGTPCTTAFDLQVTSDGVAGIKEHEPDDEDDTPSFGTPDDTKDDDRKRHDPEDEHLIQGSFEQFDEESRLESNSIAKDDPGGRGLGKKKDSYF